MSDPVIDDVDRAILDLIQGDARHATNARISEHTSVSASTVSKRIAGLEERGVIRGYRTVLDYERAGFPLQVLFVCTAPVVDRERLVEETLSVDGVLSVRELMTGEENVHVRVIGTSNDDITRIARHLDGMGYAITDEILMRDEYHRASLPFRGGADGES